MKTLFIFVSVMVVLFLAAPTKIEAQKRKATSKASRVAIISQPGKCAVTVRKDLLPNRAVVVVGCDDLGISVIKSPDGSIESFRPTNGGIVVLDDELNLIFKWDACSACGGFFSHFAGMKKFRGHNALIVQLVNGPRLDAGGRAEPTVPLYFNGKKFTFAEMPAP